MDRAGTPPGLRALHWFNDPRRREQAINVVLWRCLSDFVSPEVPGAEPTVLAVLGAEPAVLAVLGAEPAVLAVLGAAKTFARR
jgi:hypothetical protein